MKYFYFILIFLNLFLISCGEKTEEEKVDSSKSTVTNPNGMSEMSMIMEDWYTDMKNISDVLKTGKMYSVNTPTMETRNIYKAKTSKDNIHGKQFDAFVQSYYYNYGQISNASSWKEQVDEFNLTVTVCTNCHMEFCPGPIVRIKKLEVYNGE